MSSVLGTFTASPGFHYYGLCWSPFSGGLLAAVSGTNYGIKGSGRLEVLSTGGGGAGAAPHRRVLLDWPDLVAAVAWSELDPHVLLIGAGDRAVALIHTETGQVLRCAREHVAEVSAVRWGTVRGQRAVLSASWDGTARQWDAESLRCTGVFASPARARVYDVAWSPHEADMFATADGSGALCIWSSTAAGAAPAVRVPVSPSELLSVDWSRYHAQRVVTAGVDGCVRTWDLRAPGRPLHLMTGHRQAVKKVRCAAFDADLMATVSYDMTTRLWSAAAGACVAVLATQKEFVFDVDWSVLERGVLAWCGWDGTVRVHRLTGLPGRPALAA